MECDVIPDCTQEVDPLGNLDNCDPLSDESCSYGGSLNAQIISSNHSSFIIHPSTPQHIKIHPTTKKITPPTLTATTATAENTKSTKHNHSLRKMLPRQNAATKSSSVNQQSSTSSAAASTFTSPTTTFAADLTINNATTVANQPQASTMREVLASIPGFCIKPRRRSNKKLSTAAQLQQTRDEGLIDLETPDSILTSTNLRDLLNRQTFSLLPPLYQYKLIQLLPIVDRPVIDSESPTIRLNSSSLNNEFFARACLEWRDRLDEGEFTPENQLKLRAEAEKEKSKLDPWKLKHFEPIWGDNGQSTSKKLANQINEGKQQKQQQQAIVVKSTAVTQTVVNDSVTRTTAASAAVIPTATITKLPVTPLIDSCSDGTEIIDETSNNPLPSTSSSSLALTQMTTIATTTSTTVSSLSPSSNNGSSSTSTSYTTSSGRLIKSPSSYSSLTYAQQQKRQRTVGAVTRSSASTSPMAVVTTPIEPQPQIQPTQPPSPPQPSECPTKISNPVPDLLPLRSKLIRSSNSNSSPDHSTTSTSSVCKDIDTVDYSSHPPADISIIETTGTAESIAATRTPPYSDIKPNVEIISLGCVEPSSISLHQSPKRSLKRSVSPSDAKTNTGNDNKISKYTHHEQNSSKLMQQCTTSSIIEVIKIERPMPSPHKLTTATTTTTTITTTTTTSTTIVTPLTTISSVVTESILQPHSSITTTTTVKTIELTTESPATLQMCHQDESAKVKSKNVEKMLIKDFLPEQSIVADVDEQMCLSVDDETKPISQSSTIFKSEQTHELVPLLSQEIIPQKLEQTTNEDDDEYLVKLELENDKIDESIINYDDDLYNNKLHFDATPNPTTDLSDTIHQHTTNSGDSGASTSSTIGVNAVASDDQNIDTPPSLRLSGECSEYSNDPNSLSGGATTLENQIIDESKFDSNFTNNETDSLTSFCTNDMKLENIYKIQNFEGVLQIQPNSLTLEQDHHIVQRGDGLLCNSGGSGGGVGGAGNGDDSSNSTTALADCSGENSADTAVEELEPSIQNLEPIEDDPIEQKFTDAENYVLESGEISRDSGEANSLPVDSKLSNTEDDIQAKMFAAAMARAFDSVPGNIPVAMTVVNPTDNTEVIPMQETLEVRLKESTYQVLSDWPSFNIKMEKSPGHQSSDDFNLDGNTSAANDILLKQNQQKNYTKINHQSQQQHPIYSTASQVKLELEVTLTPEPEVSSTVVSNNSTNSCDSDQSSSNEDTLTKSSSSLSTNNMPTVIPPTTIVCLPMVTVPNSVSHNNTSNMHYITTQNPATVVLPQNVQKQFVQQQQQGVYTASTNQQQQQQPQHRVAIQQPRTAVVASSSSIPYLSIATTQPLRAVPNTTQNRPKLPQQKSGRGRSNNNRPPPGAVNLERSYQICQAVIQNSPNRHQLKGQLRPPPSMIGSTAGGQTSNNKKDEPNVVKMQSNGQPRVTFSKKGFVQRQPSPVLVRHVFTTNQGIPVSMAVLPSGVHQSQQQQQHMQQQQQQQLSSGTNSSDSSSSGQLNPSGQYILVQRAGIVQNDNQAPRASSAPPAQNQQAQSVTGTPITGRGRPASVDNDNLSGQDAQQYTETTPNIQTITRKVPNQGFVYGDISMETTYPHYSISGENTPPNCACSLNAMVICQQCGVFCHDECMGSSKLCLSCVIR